MAIKRDGRYHARHLAFVIRPQLPLFLLQPATHRRLAQLEILANLRDRQPLVMNHLDHLQLEGRIKTSPLSFNCVHLDG